MAQQAGMAQFIDVAVVPHPSMPEGFCGRWRRAPDRAEQACSHAYYSPDDGPDGVYAVAAQWSDGRRTPARRLWVEDSAAGVSVLLVGGDWGLRLWREGDGAELAEPYLLLDA